MAAAFNSDGIGVRRGELRAIEELFDPLRVFRCGPASLPAGTAGLGDRVRVGEIVPAHLCERAFQKPPTGGGSFQGGYTYPG